MKIHYDIQTLEPGQLVELFDLDATAIGGEVLRFHGHTQVGSIYWQGNEYSPWAIQAEGFARNGQGQQPTPRLSVGNVNGFVSALCLYLQDMVGAKLTRHRTLGRYLDAVNFPPKPSEGPSLVLDFTGLLDVGNSPTLSLNFATGRYEAASPYYAVWEGNPDADPTEEMPQEVWYIEQKIDETNESVTFELSSALDFGDVQLPRRQIVANVCMWLTIGGYRGPYCGYTGSAYFDKDDNPVADPALDRCGGRVNSCKCRFGENNPLPYGSFPAADLIRT